MYGLYPTYSSCYASTNSHRFKLAHPFDPLLLELVLNFRVPPLCPVASVSVDLLSFTVVGEIIPSGSQILATWLSIPFLVKGWLSGVILLMPHRPDNFARVLRIFTF